MLRKTIKHWLGFEVPTFEYSVALGNALVLAERRLTDSATATGIVGAKRQRVRLLVRGVGLIEYVIMAEDIEGIRAAAHAKEDAQCFVGS